MDTAEKLLGVSRIEVGDDPFNGDAGIDRAKLAFRGDCFWQGLRGVGFIEKRLALEIRGLDEIAVDDTEIADSRAHQKIGSRGTDGAAADNSGARSVDFLLALRTDAGEEYLARVFFLKRIVHESLDLAGPQRCPSSYIIAPRDAGEATPLCYASSERVEG